MEPSWTKESEGASENRSASRDHLNVVTGAYMQSKDRVDMYQILSYMAIAFVVPQMKVLEILILATTILKTTLGHAVAEWHRILIALVELCTTVPPSAAHACDAYSADEQYTPN